MRCFEIDAARAAVLSCAVAAFGFSGGEAWAQPGPLGFGDGVEVVTEHTVSADGTTFEISSPGGGFFFDPGAGAWEKILLPPSNGFVPDQVYTIREWVSFFPPPTGVAPMPLADWHEEIALGVDDQIWDVWVRDSDPVISLDPDSMDPLPGLTSMISADGLDLWFDFDPLDVPAGGLMLHITKEFRFIGSTVSFDPVVITQYPTPAPGAAVLLGAAGVGWAGRRRRA